MKLQQLSLFVENKPGRLNAPCKLLANAGLNIVTLSLADTAQFGIMRLIMRDWQKARELLKAANYVVNITEVVAIEVSDKPGGLLALLEILEKGQVNIEYMYAFTAGTAQTAIMIFRFEDPDTAIELLQQHKVNVLKGVELFERTGRGG